MVVVRLLGTIHIFQYNRMKGGLDFIQFESKTHAVFVLNW